MADNPSGTLPFGFRCPTKLHEGGPFTSILESLAKFAGCFFGVSFFCTVCGQMAEFVSDPVAEPAFSCVAIIVGEDRLAREVNEHQAAVTDRDVEVEIVGGD